MEYVSFFESEVIFFVTRHLPHLILENFLNPAISISAWSLVEKKKLRKVHGGWPRKEGQLKDNKENIIEPTVIHTCVCTAAKERNKFQQGL